MRKKLIFVISFALIICFPTSANSAIKAGSACKKLNQVISENGLKFTCVKKGRNLVWSVGQEPVKPTDWQNLESRYQGITYWAWKQGNLDAQKSRSNAATLTEWIGPKSKKLNANAQLGIDLTSRLFLSKQEPKVVHIIYFQYKDVDWAQDTFNKLMSNQNNFSNEAAKSCPAPDRCSAASAFINQNGDGIMLVGVNDSGQPDRYHSTGGIESHEYIHVIQNFIMINVDGRMALLPRWWCEGQANYGSSASIFYNSFDRYFNERQIDDLRKGDWLTEDWVSNFINPDNWTPGPNTQSWAVWDKYPAFRVYDVGLAVMEILVALKGPNSTLEMLENMAAGLNFEAAFMKTYSISWKDAVPIISRTIAKQYKI